MQDNQINEIEFTQTYNIYGNSKYKAFSEKFLLMEGNQVKLKPFAISTTLITQDLYKKIMRDDINTNFSPSYNELLCQHKKIHRFKVYKLYSLFVFQFIALEGFIHFIRYTVI